VTHTHLVGLTLPVPWAGTPHTMAGFIHTVNPALELPSPG